MATQAFDHMPGMFAWDPAPLSSDPWLEEYRTVLSELRDWLFEEAAGQGVEGAIDVRERFASLDAGSADRVTLAPQTARRLLVGDLNRDTIEFLQHSCDAEIATPDHPPRTSMWTAVGDRYIPGSVMQVEPGLAAAGLDAARPYVAPRAGSIIIDFVSPGTHRICGPSGFVATTPTLEDASRVQGKILAALAFITSVVPDIARFVDRQILTLILRTEDTNTATGSSSAPDYIGEAVLWNAQVAAVSAADIAEQLIHEAIHNHAYRVELHAPFLVGAPSQALPRILSPWSGRPLTVHSYLHASLVWYGLAHFWSAALERDVLSERDGIPRLTRCVRGFRTEAVTVLGEAHRMVDDNLLAVLDWLRLTARERWGDECEASGLRPGGGWR